MSRYRNIRVIPVRDDEDNALYGEPEGDAAGTTAPPAVDREEGTAVDGEDYRVAVARKSRR